MGATNNGRFLTNEGGFGSVKFAYGAFCKERTGAGVLGAPNNGSFLTNKGSFRSIEFAYGAFCKERIGAGVLGAPINGSFMTSGGGSLIYVLLELTKGRFGLEFL